MSLINEALKKAQRQRTAENTAATTPQQAPTAVPAPLPDNRLPIRRRKPAPAQTIVLLSVGGTLLFIGACVTTFILFSTNGADESPVVHKTPVKVSPVTTTPQSAAPTEVTVVSMLPAPTPTPVKEPTPTAPAAEPTPVPTPATAVVTPPAPVVTPPPVAPAAPAAPQPAPVAAALSTPVAVAPTPTIPTPSAPATASVSRPNPAVYAFLSKIRVAGIRASKTDPRVIMNDRMFKVNDMVDNELQLRLTGISSLSLTFTDAGGYVYTRDF